MPSELTDINVDVVIQDLLARVPEKLRVQLLPDVEELINMGGRTYTGLLNVLTAAATNERKTAVFILGLIDDPRIAPLLLSVAQDLTQNISVREQALSSLAGLRESRMFPDLQLMYVEDESMSIRQQVLRGIGMMNTDATIRDQVVQFLSGILRDSQTEPLLRAEAAQGLNHAQCETAIPVLMAALDDPEPVVRSTAACALGCLHAADALPRLEKMANHDNALVVDSPPGYKTVKEAVLDAIDSINGVTTETLEDW